MILKVSSNPKHSKILQSVLTTALQNVKMPNGSKLECREFPICCSFQYPRCFFFWLTTILIIFTWTTRASACQVTALAKALHGGPAEWRSTASEWKHHSVFSLVLFPLLFGSQTAKELPPEEQYELLYFFLLLFVSMRIAAFPFVLHAFHYLQKLIHEMALFFLHFRHNHSKIYFTLKLKTAYGILATEYNVLVNSFPHSVFLCNHYLSSH